MTTQSKKNNDETKLDRKKTYADNAVEVLDWVRGTNAAGEKAEAEAKKKADAAAAIFMVLVIGAWRLDSKLNEWWTCKIKNLMVIKGEKDVEETRVRCHARSKK